MGILLGVFLGFVWLHGMRWGYRHELQQIMTDLNGEGGTEEEVEKTARPYLLLVSASWPMQAMHQILKYALDRGVP